ncbi:MAG TPA: hypothetical protein DCL77_02200 [Prolixibacteraceae bacterium]|nr:hypothetical protein [Prolixibacteraceae bacterium]
MKRIATQILFFLVIVNLVTSCKPKALQIYIPKDATSKEMLAASEIRRYIYLRTGGLAEIVSSEQPTGSGKLIVVSRMGENQVPSDLQAEEFYLKTEKDGSMEKLIVSGGSDQAVLYAAYEFAEQLGMRFYLHGDVVPDGKIALNISDLNIRQKPLFSIRGVQPFHDFPEGPDWWNVNDYRAIISQLPKMKMNFIGFHTYPFQAKFSDGPKAEPLVWIGKEDEVNADGTVKTAYPVLHFNTNDSTWGYYPVKTSDFTYGASQIFETDTYGADYMKNVSSWPHTEAENIKIVNESGKMLNDAFLMAKKLGVKTCVGTETPLIIPKEVKDRLGIKAETDQQVKELYKGMFSRIQKTYPLDYYWLWTPENWTWQGATDAEVAKTEKDMQLAYEVLNEMGKPFQLATCGWVLGPPKDRTQFDRVLPKDMPFSCINRGVGYTPVDKGFQAITDRPKWSIPWMEDDPDLIGTQLWVGRIKKDALDSYRYGCNGLIGIHWRTRDLSPNVSALAKAAWTANQWEKLPEAANRDLPTTDFYTDWSKSEFGFYNKKLVDLLVWLDSHGQEMKEGYKGDATMNVTDWIGGPGGLMTNKAVEELTERINRYKFIPQMEAILPNVMGAGNKERFEYWLTNLKYNRSLLETALVYKKLLMSIEDIKKENDQAKKQQMANDIALPLRLELKGRWEQTIELLLAKASTTGEMGMIANLEMHNYQHNQILTGQDKFLQDLGVNLPEKAFPGKEYLGKTRVIVPTDESILTKGMDFYLRVRILSPEKQVSGKLVWRSFGNGKFNSIELKRMDRNVFEVTIPAAQINDDFEYYIEVSAGGEVVKYPVTTPDINRTVVLMK